MASEAQPAHILAVAERLFLRHGFAGTSMEMLIGATGGSKRDIYRLFGNKRGLFRQVVAELADAGASAMRACSAGETLEATLTGIARTFMRFLLSERALNLHRLMVADAARSLDEGEEFLRYGPDAAYQVVEDHLQTYPAGFATNPEIIRHAARLFIDGVSADLQLQALLGKSISDVSVEARIAFAVMLFSAGWHRSNVGKESR